MVSIIIPVYRKEDSLSQCLDSVVKQQYSNIEIILVDDGSPDKCGIICDEYARKYKKIVVIHQENMGVSSARNIGIKYAKGEFITFVDADDVIKPQFISDLMKLFNVDVDVVVGINRPVRYDFCESMSGKEASMRMFLDDNFGVNVWGKIYRRELLSDELFPVGVKMGEDMYALYKVLGKAKNVFYTSVNHYEQKKSFNQSNDNANIDDFYVPIKYLEKFIDASKFDKNETFALYHALVRRSIWMINMLSDNSKRKNYLKYWKVSLNNINKFISLYGFDNRLALKDRLCMGMIKYLPYVYIKILSIKKVI